MITVFFATLNDHKIYEVSKILASEAEGQAPLGVTMKTVAGLQLPGEWQETGTTFEQNAKIKVEFVREHLLALPDDHPERQAAQVGILAEDSGICVAALDGGPGIHSKRFSELAGDPVTGEDEDAANNRRLLAALAGQSLPSERKAYYHCAVAYWQPGQDIVCFEGQVHGTIAMETKGTGGFGYDPLFIPDGYEQSFGELPEQLKHRLSHRYRGISAWASWLRHS